MKKTIMGIMMVAMIILAVIAGIRWWNLCWEVFHLTNIRFSAKFVSGISEDGVLRMVGYGWIFYMIGRPIIALLGLDFIRTIVDVLWTEKKVEETA